MKPLKECPFCRSKMIVVKDRFGHEKGVHEKGPFWCPVSFIQIEEHPFSLGEDIRITTPEYWNKRERLKKVK